ncbi:MAG: urate hydroxylase PuuD [Acidobacteria bacterium]|nr:urate hydroxylase PuuD [Acidobacteriota bacterium]
MAYVHISLAEDSRTNFYMLLRVIHLLTGITWIGLLYFFNFVSFPLLKDLDPPTRAKVMPPLMLRALWLFRWSALITVLSGLAYWGSILSTAAQTVGASSGTALGTFFLIWTSAWAILYALLLPGKGVLDKGPVLGILVAIVVTAASYLFLRFNGHGWEGNRILAIGIGGGMGWVMLLNVWGIVWRIQKRLIAWTKANAENGTPIPEQSKRMARMSFLTARISAFLSIPLLFFMAVATHYPMFSG